MDSTRSSYYGRYHSESDAWSFGILLWETFSLGVCPHPGMTNQQAQEQVERRYQMSVSQQCPECIYKIMLKSWDYKLENRPKFRELEREMPSKRKSHSDETLLNSDFRTLIFQQSNLFFSLTSLYHIIWNILLWLFFFEKYVQL